MIKRSFTVMAVIILFMAVASGSVSGTETSGKVRVFVSILPEKYFVERIGGDNVIARVLVGPGQSPATYEPTPRQMAELSQSRVFFRIGVPFEDSLMPKIQSTFKDLTVVDTRKGIALRKMESDVEHHGHEADEAHGHAEKGGDEADKHEDREHGHDHIAGAPDPHIWLDPIRVKTVARNICDALVRVDPSRAAVYRKNLKAFRDDLDRVNAQIARALAPIKGKELFVFHPAYGYFADRYGLKQVAVEIGGKEPSAKQLSSLIDKARHDHVKVIFVQPQFDMKYAKTIANATGAAVVSLDPLAADYIKNLQDMATKVESALSKQK